MKKYVIVINDRGAWYYNAEHHYTRNIERATMYETRAKAESDISKAQGCTLARVAIQEIEADLIIADAQDARTIQYFRDELAKLTRKTGLIIGGCGCCNSPFLHFDLTASQAKNGHYGAGMSEVQWETE